HFIVRRRGSRRRAGAGCLRVRADERSLGRRAPLEVSSYGGRCEDIGGVCPPDPSRCPPDTGVGWAAGGVLGQENEMCHVAQFGKWSVLGRGPAMRRLFVC